MVWMHIRLITILTAVFVLHGLLMLMLTTMLARIEICMRVLNRMFMLGGVLMPNFAARVGMTGVAVVLWGRRRHCFLPCFVCVIVTLAVV